MKTCKHTKLKDIKILNYTHDPSTWPMYLVTCKCGKQAYLYDKYLTEEEKQFAIEQKKANKRNELFIYEGIKD